MQFISNGTWKGNLGLGLAERELSCLLAVAAGQTDKEIAKHDGLSPRSIKGRIESCMHKLGVYKRPALVAEAFRRGLISPMILTICAVLVGQSATNDNSMNRIRRPGERRIETRVAVRRIEAFHAA
ncbi:regulatory protein, luxR family [Pseudomonas synxantha]|jgi:DNA-binding CsgD family transcriptional regulator|uniref:Transcriptional regulator n=1 Tax=Pseudomonas synxantha TaxID=47883 RepID=A0AAX3HZS4_9PSED|nr:LuxR C-terminal-related transcriptional regulator [Pseudomonas synxantha]KRP50266.1 LuxR family transcriptional regulator [Pseudomonas synxantha]SDU68888.1 regulatory protein, luxR family [Pseudomonas synxantha]VTQ88010.1 putative transcriptional regulator [Pseudomonas synxantha]